MVAHIADGQLQPGAEDESCQLAVLHAEVVSLISTLVGELCDAAGVGSLT